MPYLDAPMPEAYPIPQFLWESIDVVLLKKAKELAKEVAAELKVDAKLLISELNREDRSRFNIIQEEEEVASYQCQALVQRGPVYTRCRCATLSPHPRKCSTHEKYATPAPVGLESVQRVVDSDTVYFTKDTIVFRETGEECGVLKGTVLTLFEYE
jgi:hypothetical protein